MLKMQSAVMVNGKFEGSYVNKNGETVPTYGIASICDGRANEMQVNKDIFDAVEEGHRYILEGELGISRYGQYWNFKKVLEDITEKSKKA